MQTDEFSAKVSNGLDPYPALIFGERKKCNLNRSVLGYAAASLMAEKKILFKIEFFSTFLTGESIQPTTIINQIDNKTYVPNVFTSLSLICNDYCFRDEIGMHDEITRDEIGMHGEITTHLTRDEIGLHGEIRAHLIVVNEPINLC